MGVVPLRNTKSIDELADELEMMLSTMSKSLVDHPNDIVINRATNANGLVAFEVTCREDEAGTLVGKRGAHADSMRQLLLAAAAARRLRVTVLFMSAQGDRLNRR